MTFAKADVRDTARLCALTVQAVWIEEGIRRHGHWAEAGRAAAELRSPVRLTGEI